MAYTRIILPPDAALPLITAAAELSDATGASVINGEIPADADQSTIIVATAVMLGNIPGALDIAGSDKLDGKEWELVKLTEKGLVISGSSPRNVCRAALFWIDDPRNETDRLSLERFEEVFTLWDSSFNQWYRHAKGFDKRRHIRELARCGHTAVEVNRYVDAGGWHVNNRKFPNDPYAWFLSYAPALDAFVESSLIEGIYDPRELAANLEDLKESTDIAREYGLKPGFVAYEPRCVSEKVFDKYPELRGARTDHPGRSLEPRYTLDIANPRVLKHYAESITSLLEEIPDLRYFNFWTGDSGSGFPFAKWLYAGPNGSYLAKGKKLERMIADWSGAIVNAGRKINPEFEVIMEVSWEYQLDELGKIVPALPDGVTLSHGLGGETKKRCHDREIKEWGGNVAQTQIGTTGPYIELDRKHDKEPYGGIVGSQWWDLEPIMGIGFPTVIAKKFKVLKEMSLARIFNRGGVIAPGLCMHNINQEMIIECLRSDPDKIDVNRFLLEKALSWTDGDKQAADTLLFAWKESENALVNFPVLSWYHKGGALTQARWLTRPLVPDFDLLSESERAPHERELFPLESDIARKNLYFEGGIRLHSDEDGRWAAEAYDKAMLPSLEKIVAALDKALAAKEIEFVRDQRDRYCGLLLAMRTMRNSMAAQAAINFYLKGENQASEREILDQAIEAEIRNTEDWIEALKSSKTNFFRISAVRETPFLHKTPVEDMKVRLAAMKAHRGDEPGPFLQEIIDGVDYMQAWAGYYDDQE